MQKNAINFPQKVNFLFFNYWLESLVAFLFQKNSGRFMDISETTYYHLLFLVCFN